MRAISMTKKKDNYFSQYVKEDDKKSNRLSFDFNTIHGIVFWDFIVLSAGVSIDYNIKETF
ncbi:MAG: hypothetical protein ACI9Q9_000126 [Flavobacterium sp.]|jgi:hypothetical protein